MSGDRFGGYGAAALVAGDSILYAGNRSGIHVSRTQGESWAVVAEFPNVPTGARSITETEIKHAVLSLALDPGGSLVAGTAEGGVFRQYSPGRWAASNAGLANAAIRTIVSAGRGPGVVYATTEGRVFKSDDGGGSWRVVLHETGLDNTVRGVAISSAWPDILAATGSLTTRVSRDGGQSWSAPFPPELLWLDRLVFSPVDPNVLYAGTVWAEDGIRVSRDGGHTWEQSPVMSAEFRVRQIAVTADGERIYLATSRGLAQAATDDLTWTVGLLRQASVSALALDPAHPGVVLAGTPFGQLWRSMDEGNTWTQLGRAAREGQGITAILIAPGPPQPIYVGTQGAGVLVSTDGGTSWETINRGLASTDITGFALDGSIRRLYAGTARAGVFVTGLPDSSTTAVATEPRTTPSLRIEGVYPNPFNGSVRVAYSVDREGPVTLRVYDALGQRLITLVDGPLGAGAHTALWDGANGSGRQVGSGTYFLRLQTPGGERVAKAQVVR